MASTDTSPFPFGFRSPSDQDFGMTARSIVEHAEDNIRKSRGSALLYLVPSILYYLLFSGGIALVLWGFGVNLPKPWFLMVCAAVFLLLSLLGQHYQMQAISFEHAAFKFQAVMLLQATIIRLFTAAFFIFPFRIIRNLSKLFPRKARISPQVLNLSVHLAAGLDVPIRLAELRAILPGGADHRLLKESLILLKWAGFIHVVHQAGDILIFPSHARDSLVSSIPEQSGGVVAFADLLATPGESSVQEVYTPSLETSGAVSSAQKSLPTWLDRYLNHPIRNTLILGAAFIMLLVIYKTTMGIYRSLPVSVAKAVLPVSGDITAIAWRDGQYYLGRGSEVEISNGLNTLPHMTHSLLGLKKLWGEAGIGTATGETKVSFQQIYSVLPDPGGRYLLVFGKWKCDPGPTSCGTTGHVIVDIENRTLFPCNQFNRYSNPAVKGWWDSGRLLIARNTPLYDKGGGGRITSDNLAGSLTALDVQTGLMTSIYTPRESYFGSAGRENGKRIFLAADSEAVKLTDKTIFTFFEYQDFKRVSVFKIPVIGFQPVVRHSELDGTGRYWIVVIEFSPPLAKIHQGSLYTFWVINRKGSRWVKTEENGGKSLLLLETFSYASGSMFGYLKTPWEPEYVIRQLNF